MVNQRLLNLAKFSQNAYDVRFRLGDPNNNHTLIAQEYNSANSFGAQASYDAASNNLIIGFAGTDGPIDLLVDGVLATIGVSPQDGSARNFTDNARAAQRMGAINSTANDQQ